jgi:xanthine dehydrogenase iron-sulfur cluster and FAD-binding subunit A
MARYALEPLQPLMILPITNLMQELIPDIKAFFKLVSSEPIRNTGTVAGNVVNASPIGDLIHYVAGDEC